MLAKLRNYFFTGLLVAGPAGITIYLVLSLISWVDGWVKPYLPSAYNPDHYLPFTVPGFGLIIAFALIALIGFLTANIVGRTLVSYSEEALNRMPLVRNLYRGLKQIFSSVLTERGSSFQKVALIEFPRQGIWTIGFIAAPTRGEIARALAEEDKMLTIYVPTTPNPTGGYLLFARQSEVKILEMSVEDAAKFVISFGLVLNETQAAELQSVTLP